MSLHGKHHLLSMEWHNGERCSGFTAAASQGAAKAVKVGPSPTETTTARAAEPLCLQNLSPHTQMSHPLTVILDSWQQSEDYIVLVTFLCPLTIGLFPFLDAAGVYCSTCLFLRRVKHLHLFSWPHQAKHLSSSLWIFPFWPSKLHLVQQK